MTKVDIFSGFLGAGKTTLIRKLIEEAYGDEKIVLIENEFGEIGVDKGFLKNTGSLRRFDREINRKINPKRVAKNKKCPGQSVSVRSLKNVRLTL